LEQKKRDLELIQAKNMKILCKNIKHSPCLQLIKEQQATREVGTARARPANLLLLLLLLGQAVCLVYF